MRRTVTEVLRRGFENMVANWPLVAIRIAESIVFVVICVGAVFAVIVPIALSIGLGAENMTMPADPSDAAALIISILTEHLVMVLWVLVVITLVLLVMVALHSFVTAGCARVYVDGERQVAASVAPDRVNMRAFTADRWLQGGRQAWWPVFWIYNVTWGIAGIIILIPFALLLAIILLMRESVPAMAVTGCVGLIFGILFIIPVAIVTGIWTQKAIVDAAARNTGVRDSLRAAWREFVTDFGRHIAVAVVMIVVTMAAGMAFGSLSALSSIGHQQPAFNIVMMPARFATSIINSIFSAAVGAWFLACFASLAVETS